MTEPAMILTGAELPALIAALKADGRRVLGPRLGDGAIVYDAIDGIEDLPAGWGDEQEGGTYRLVRRDGDALFGYTVAPQSWKRFLHPPKLRLWRAERDDGKGLAITASAAAEAVPPLAFIGVRACELTAIRIQDRVFANDPLYTRRRAAAFMVAVNCGQAGRTCFCASMDAGPQVGAGADIAMTELLDEGRHDFLLVAASPAGAALMALLPGRPATETDHAAARRVAARTAAGMGRTMPADAADRLAANLMHPRWQATSERCLACGNCTMVCPTCFCTDIEDTTDLTGAVAERWRLWDSCFNLEFSYIHGGSVRASGAARYRQWISHKLSTWHRQFGTSGCVGCGRCIAWCPVGIDITEEVHALG